MAISLRQNAVADTLSNALINIIEEDGLFSGGYGELLSAATKQTGYFGDQLVIRSVDKIHGFDFDETSAFNNNVLATFKPTVSETTLVLENPRVYPISIFSVMNKMAFGSEGGWSGFTTLVQRSLAESPKIDLEQAYNVFVGSTPFKNKSGNEIQKTLDAVTDWSTADKAILSTATICEDISKITGEMRDAGSKYNQLGYIRTVREPKVIFNQKYYDKMVKHGETVSFNADKLGVKAYYVLPEYYFGTVNSAAIAKADIADYKVCYACEVASATGGDPIHKDVGDTLSANQAPVTSYDANGKVASIGTEWAAGTVYQTNDKIICKIASELDPVLMAINSTDSWYNPYSRVTNYYALLLRSTFKRLPYICGCTIYDHA